MTVYTEKKNTIYEVITDYEGFVCECSVKYVTDTFKDGDFLTKSSEKEIVSLEQQKQNLSMLQEAN